MKQPFLVFLLMGMLPVLSFVPAMATENIVNTAQNQHPLSPESLQDWADQLAVFPKPQLQQRLAQAPEKAQRLIELLIEDILLAQNFGNRPMLKIPAAIATQLAAHSHPKLQQAYKLVQTPNPDLLSQLITLDPGESLLAFLLGLKEVQDSTPSAELERLVPERRVVASLVVDFDLDVLTDDDSEPEPPPPETFLDFIWLLNQEESAEFKAALNKLEASELFRQSELATLARLQLIRLQVFEASALKALNALATDLRLSEALRIEALITQGRLAFKQDPASALASWHQAKVWLAQLPQAHHLWLMLAHEYAAAGLLELARPLYLKQAQDVTNPFRLRVFKEIKRLDDAELLASLNPLLADPSPKIRAAAAALLTAESETPELINSLNRLLQDPAPEVQVAALQHIQEGSKELVEAFYPKLQTYLQSSDPTLQSAALAIVRDHRLKEFVPFIVSHLPVASPEAQGAFLVALGDLGQAGDADAVIPFLSSGELSIRLLAIWILTSLGNPEVIPVLQKFQQQKLSEPERQSVEEALIQLGAHQGLAQLLPHLKIEYLRSSVKQQLATQLSAGKLQLQDLLPWLEHTDPEIREPLWEQVQNLGLEPSQLEALKSRLPQALTDTPSIRLSTLNLLTQFPQWITPKLETLIQIQLQAKESDLRLLSLKLLSSRQALQASDLKALLLDPDPEVRQQAMQQEAHPSLLPFYREQLKDPESELRYLALASMRSLAVKDPQLRQETLALALQFMTNPELEDIALGILATWGSSDLLRPVLFELLEPPNGLSDQALQRPELAELGPDVRKFWPQLSLPARMQALFLLVNWEGKGALPEALALLDDFKSDQVSDEDRDDWQWLLLGQLAKIGNPGLIPLLRPYLQVPELEMGVRLLLIELGDDTQTGLMLERLRSDQPAVIASGLAMAQRTKDLNVQQEVLRLLQDRRKLPGEDNDQIDDIAFEVLYAYVRPELLPALLEQFANGDAIIRSHVKEILQGLQTNEENRNELTQHPTLLTQILPFLKSQQPEVVSSTLMFIGLLRRKEALPHLKAFAANAAPELQAQAEAIITQLEALPD